MPAKDTFQNQASSLESPISKALAVTPDDATDLPFLTRAVYLGGGGDLRVNLEDGSTLTFVGMGTGWHPLRVARVWATGTGATDIVGCW